MNKELKIALAVIAGALALCCVAGIPLYFLAQRFVGLPLTADSKQAAKVGHSIVDYTLPPGYVESFAINTTDLKMVCISSKSRPASPQMLILSQITGESDVSREEMDEMARQALAQQGQRSIDKTKAVGAQEVTIKGQSITLTVSEGEWSDGRATRQVTGAFPGNEGAIVMLMAVGDKDSWNEALLTDFLALIK